LFRLFFLVFHRAYAMPFLDYGDVVYDNFDVADTNVSVNV